MEPFFQGENSAPCPGLGSACFFYASAPMMAVRALAEEFEVPMRVKQRDADREICERALDRIDKEIDVAVNIGLYADKLAAGFN
jgi:hypothetical protein